MPKLLLTKRNIDSKKHVPLVESGRVDYFDTELKGLLLRVGKESKTFYCLVDVKDQETGQFKSKREKLGAYGELTPEEARAMAPEIIKRLREGRPAREEAPPTLQSLYDRYLKDKPLSAGTRTLYESYIPRMFESWLDLTLPQLDRALAPEVVIDKFQHIRETSGPGAANNSFKCLQAIIGYGEILYPQHLHRNPVKVLSNGGQWVKMKGRDDCLEPDQFPVFAEGLLSLTPVHRDCYLFALYHGVRPKEAYSLEWSNVDFMKGTSTFQHGTETSKRSYTVPLSAQSRVILERRQEASAEGELYVFPKQSARNKHGHLMLRSDDLKNKTGLEISVHGLRRSFITTGERLRLRREDINLLTGHIDGSVIGKHYSCLTPEDLKPTLQTITNEIERLLKGEAAKVIDMRTRRRATGK